MRFLSKAPKKILEGRCLLRLDFNTEDEWRLEATLPTIKFLKKHASSVVIVGHRGRPDDLRLKNGHPVKVPAKFSMRRDAKFLEKALKSKVHFIPHFNFHEMEDEIAKSRKGSIFVVENLRFLEGEEFNDAKLGKDLASLGDYYVNDAFAVSHRKASSVVAVTKHLPSFVGLELETELKHLSHLHGKPKHPFVLIFGGGKSHDKIPVMDSFAKSADYFIVGGGVANTFLKMQGFDIGESRADTTPSPKAKKFLKDNRLILPVDYVQSDGKILDVGPLSVTHAAAIISEAKTIIWNGPFGFIEKSRYAKGSLGIAKAIAKNKQTFSLAGGGETVMFLKDHSLDNKFSFISTGGGAMLEFLAGKKLPGIEALKKHKIMNYDLPLTERDLVFFDGEFTGLEFDHELIEIGFVKAKRQTFEIIEEGDIKMHAKDISKADPSALEVVNYDSEEWAREGVSLEAGMKEFLKHTEDCILVGHNLTLDWLRLSQALHATGLKANYYYKGLDTFSFGWLMFGEDPNFARMSLRELAEHFGVDRGQAHRAIDDARTTYGIFKALVKKYEDLKNK